MENKTNQKKQGKGRQRESERKGKQKTSCSGQLDGEVTECMLMSVILSAAEGPQTQFFLSTIQFSQGPGQAPFWRTCPCSCSWGCWLEHALVMAIFSCVFYLSSFSCRINQKIQNQKYERDLGKGQVSCQKQSHETSHEKLTVISGYSQMQDSENNIMGTRQTTGTAPAETQIHT